MATAVPPASVPPVRPGFFANIGSLVSARFFMTASQILVLPFLARHLSIEEFALMALAMAVVIFVSVLSDAGLGRSLIRSKEYDIAEWSTVFWLLVGVGVALCVGVLALAPLWAWYLDAPSLLIILSVLSVVPLFQAISAAPNAEIERREAYTSLAKLQVYAAASGLITAIVLAFAGAGVWALVFQQVVLAGFRLVGVMMLSRFRPRLVFARTHLKGHLGFARDSVVTSLIAVAQNEAATVAIAKLLGAGPLGYFAMSQRFSRLPQFGLAGPMSAVVYVRMTKVQHAPEQLVAIYLSATRLLATALMPPMALIAAAGPEIFSALLSEKWAPVAPVFALSIPGLVLEAATVTCLVCLFRAVGRTDLQVKITLLSVLLRLPLVIAAALISVEAVAASLTLWALLYVPIVWRIAGRIVPLSFRACLGAIAKPTLVSLAAAGAYLAPWQPEGVSSWMAIGVAMGLTLLVYGILAIIDRTRLKQAIGLFK